jgi:RecB family endonuclease NucS
MRLVAARCEIHYTGRLTATLPEAVRSLVLKTDRAVVVDEDSGV